MKRTNVLVMLFLLLSAFICCPVFAEEQQSLPYYVSDTAGLMNMDQWQQLESEAKRISEKYQCGVYIVTLDDFRNYRSGSEDFWAFLRTSSRATVWVWERNRTESCSL